MIGILGGMGTQAGLDFCNKLAILNRGKIDQDYPLFLLYNKSNIPGRPESIGIHTGKLSNKANNKKTRGTPSFNTETPNKGIAIKTAGTKPIKVLNIAVRVRAAIISLILMGAINKFVKFLLHISSRNIILKLILARNKKSYKIAAVSITPTVLL